MSLTLIYSFATVWLNSTVLKIHTWTSTFKESKMHYLTHPNSISHTHTHTQTHTHVCIHMNLTRVLNIWKKRPIARTSVFMWTALYLPVSMENSLENRWSQGEVYCSQLCSERILHWPNYKEGGKLLGVLNGSLSSILTSKPSSVHSRGGVNISGCSPWLGISWQMRMCLWQREKLIRGWEMAALGLPRNEPRLPVNGSDLGCGPAAENLISLSHTVLILLKKI